jgi:two-component system, cell cycle sensor histidine kinase and response regulator CckA
MIKPSSRNFNVGAASFLIAFFITVALLFLYLIRPPFIQFFNYRLTDLILESDDSPLPAEAVVLVDLDEKSLSKSGQWPWPRYRLARLMKKLQAKGAISIGLDMILAEPDRTSPKNWRRDMVSEMGYDVILDDVPPELYDYDAILAETFSKGPFVLGFKFLFEEKPWISNACILHPANLAWIQNETSTTFSKDQLFKAKRVDCNLPQLSNSVSYSGFLNAAPDLDGLLRRIPLLIQYQDQYYPSFGLATLMQAMKATQLIVKVSKSGQPYLLVKDKVIPMDRKAQIRLHFSVQRTPPLKISAQDVLEDRIHTSVIHGKIVFVGSSASGLEHISQTPRSFLTHEMEIHAFLVNSILGDRFVLENSTMVLWEISIGIFLAVLCIFFVARLGVFSSGFLALLLIFGMWQGTIYLFKFSDILFSPLFPASLVFFLYTSLTIFKYWEGRRAAQKETLDTLIRLKNRETQLDSIIKAVPDIIFRLDTDGRVTFVSSAILQYNCRPEELLGRRLLDLVDPNETTKAVYRVNERRTGKRSTKELELRMQLPSVSKSDGPLWRHFCVSAEGIYEEDPTGAKTFLGTQGLLRDITEQKEMQAQLVQAKKLEAIGNLASGVAHDLNNVLSALVSYPELLLLDLPKDNPMRKALISIQRSGQKAANIVQDMLTLSRRGVSTDKIINLNRVISDYLESPEFKMLLKHYPGIQVKTQLQTDLFNIKGSGTHFSKAVMNLIINAAEAMPTGGIISVFTSNIYLDRLINGYEVIPQGEYVRLRVVDEGIGISQENQKHIFEPFFTKKSMGRSGTGLGMTIIWATAKDHEGFIDVESREGEGTQLDLYLPFTREGIDEKETQFVLQDYLGTEKILVVDDIQEQLEIAQKMLSRLGYKVEGVSSGEAAVEYLQTKKVDLLVLDMIMPSGMNGFETYQRILEIHPQQKAIIASGFSESAQAKRVQELGAGAFIQKPYTLEKIGMAVREELGHKKGL